jgi:histidine triad (HIT) family protein
MSETQMPLDVCPICAGINEPILIDQTLIKSEDIVFRTDSVVALVNSFFIQGSEGHVIVVPAVHYKNLYELPDEVGSEIFQLSKLIAIAMRQAYPGCEGITVQQNNERSGGQHALHYHLHVIPRYHGDLFGTEMPTGERTPAPEAERARFSRLIQEALLVHNK